MTSPTMQRWSLYLKQGFEALAEHSHGRVSRDVCAVVVLAAAGLLIVGQAPPRRAEVRERRGVHHV